MEEITVFVILKKIPLTYLKMYVLSNLAMEFVNDNVQLLFAPLF